jgi:hypothetical protein
MSRVTLAKPRSSPEGLRVLAQPPTFHLVAPLALGACQPRLGLARGAPFLRIEHREMPPYDLGRRVALDALGAGVPAHYVARRIEQENGAVGDRCDEQAKQLVGRVAGERALGDPRIHLHGPANSTRGSLRSPL